MSYSIVACIKYVKDLCCIGGVVVAHPLHCKDRTSFLIGKMFSCCFLIILCKCLILREKKFYTRVIFFRVRLLFGSAPLLSVVLFVVLLARVRIYIEVQG